MDNLTRRALSSCNVCDAEVKTPNPGGYCEKCLIDWPTVGPELVKVLESIETIVSDALTDNEIQRGLKLRGILTLVKSATGKAR
jgi:hypothetical protein